MENPISALNEAEKRLSIVLKDKQKEAVVAILEKKDVFCVLPTGYGKSMIYGILPLAFDIMLGKTPGESIVVCVCPLNSLMIDQKRNFSSKGVVVEYVGECQDDKKVIRSVINGQVPLVLISPENITSSQVFRSMLVSRVYKERMVALTVDEAHCIKTWGDHFRRAFADIGELRSAFPNVPVLAATATATRITYDCVVNRLMMHDVHLVGLSPNRDNIYLSVVTPESIESFVKNMAENVKKRQSNYPKTVIFCQSYNDCNFMYHNFEKSLNDHITYPPGYPRTRKYRLVDLYTRGSLDEVKEEIIMEFTKTDSILRLIIATTAFGLGIDCPDIEHIYHWGPPHTIEEYVQEVGRAGRNREPSFGTLVYHGKPRNISKEMECYSKNVNECRRQFLYKNFLFYGQCSTVSPLCACCDICATVCECVSCTTST